MIFRHMPETAWSHKIRSEQRLILRIPNILRDAIIILVPRNIFRWLWKKQNYKCLPPRTLQCLLYIFLIPNRAIPKISIQSERWKKCHSEVHKFFGNYRISKLLRNPDEILSPLIRSLSLSIRRWLCDRVFDNDKEQSTFLFFHFIRRPIRLHAAFLTSRTINIRISARMWLWRMPQQAKSL